MKVVDSLEKLIRTKNFVRSKRGSTDHLTPMWLQELQVKNVSIFMHLVSTENIIWPKLTLDSSAFFFFFFLSQTKDKQELK